MALSPTTHSSCFHALLRRLHSPPLSLGCISSTFFNSSQHLEPQSLHRPCTSLAVKHCQAKPVPSHPPANQLNNTHTPPLHIPSPGLPISARASPNSSLALAAGAAAAQLAFPAQPLCPTRVPVPCGCAGLPSALTAALPTTACASGNPTVPAAGASVPLFAPRDLPLRATTHH